ncbi:hypothetical protein DNX69_06645 [Rhodopseudomonas palustris]|uniref:Uncharacterized protein n=1 Tax=Rhodopseudomonas palustris TaxID=1076 RepID=A0A323UKQ3_RHOPL|nr:hypothetical protein DNX69_06645 [Rhodopseudomonas palustris]
MFGARRQPDRRLTVERRTFEVAFRSQSAVDDQCIRCDLIVILQQSESFLTLWLPRNAATNIGKCANTYYVE